SGRLGRRGVAIPSSCRVKVKPIAKSISRIDTLIEDSWRESSRPRGRAPAAGPNQVTNLEQINKPASGHPLVHGVMWASRSRPVERCAILMGRGLVQLPLSVMLG